jgi:hypothetical protein
MLILYSKFEQSQFLMDKHCFNFYLVFNNQRPRSVGTEIAQQPKMLEHLFQTCPFAIDCWDSVCPHSSQLQIASAFLYISLSVRANIVPAVNYKWTSLKKMFKRLFLIETWKLTAIALQMEILPF